MAQPQGLNVPAIITTGIVTVVLVATVVEGVRAYYQYTVHQEEGRKAGVGAPSFISTARYEQTKVIEHGPLPIESAMTQLIESKGKLPATQPAK